MVNFDGALESDIGAQASLFLLSFNYRDELAQAASREGWQVIAARRAENAVQRFISCGAMIAVIDARGAFDEGLEGVVAFGDAVEINAAALLVIISRDDIGGLDALINAGATHYLASPFSQIELAQSLRFAERHSVRLGGGPQAVSRRRRIDNDAVYAWQVDMTNRKAILSEAFCNRIGATARDIGAFELIQHLAPRDQKTALSAVQRILKDGHPTAFTHDLADGDGAIQRVVQHLRYDSNQQLLIGMIEQIAANPDTVLQGTRDTLTGLRDLVAARHWIDLRLNGSTDDFRILLVSITRFEMINTAVGRETGDGLLHSVARLIGRLVADVGGQDVLVARTAGAEFIIGLEQGFSDQQVMLLAERLIDQIERPMLSGKHLVTLATRIAIVGRIITDSDSTHILRRASAAIAEAKTSDQTRIKMVTTADQDYANHTQMLQSDLRSALDRGEIELLFQPQVAIPSGKIIGVEALARWRHPIHGELGAVTLFAVAQQSDYLLALSAHVQKRAVEQAAAWPLELSEIRLSVNVTATDIAKPSFADTFLAMVDASGFPRARLTVEVTESGLIEDLGAAANLLATLRAGGCRVAIDDFGTGYSSLAYLKALPLDYLKIDKKLAQDITGSTRDRIVVRGVIDMARSLGLAVIAEGVETEEQLALLAREGCNYYQGFLCAEPLNLKALTALIE